jgi:ATP-dependent Clp protease ATP-binding subunit ClpA
MLRKSEAEERRPSSQPVEQLAQIFDIPAQERPSFLRFARGDWRSAPISKNEEAPWQVLASSSRSKLPASPTALIGREPDLTILCEYISAPNKRLITLIGAPGIGKTRLSIEAAR